MSEQLSAAAQAMGVPEPLVERSANAWATAQGQSVDDVLAAWAGGEAVAAAPASAPADEPAPEPAGETEPADTPPEEPAAAAASTAPAAPAAPAAASAPTSAAGPRRDTRPPVLEAPPDRPLATVAGGLAVTVLVILLGFVFPALPASTDQVRSSDMPLTSAAEEGREVYRSAGCASCHTQMVRALVADVGLGAVTLADTDQVLGYRRIGPDLSDVGSRLSPDQLASTLSGPTHPALPLSSDAVDALVDYLAESATAPPGGEEESPDATGEGETATTEEGGES